MSVTAQEPRKQVDKAPSGAAQRASSSVTPSVGTFLRRSRFWFFFAAIALIGAVISLSFSGQDTNTSALDPESSTPQGSQALAEVLRANGVTVTVARSLADAQSAASNSSTVILSDAEGVLTEDALATALSLGQQTIVLNPQFSFFYESGIEFNAGKIETPPNDEDAPLTARCDLVFSSHADKITPFGSSYSPGSGSDPQNSTGCFPDDSGAYALVTLTDIPTHDHTITLLGASDILRNDTIAREDNAALSLALFGQTSSVVWYVPGLEDSAAPAATLADLSPGWVTPVALLAMTAALCAGVWRGRRMGPLTVERLPVTVKARETVEGRGRMYASTSAREHAAQILREGTRFRLSQLIGVGTTTHDLSAPLVSLIGAAQPEIHAVLYGFPNERLSEKQLVELANNLTYCGEQTRRVLLSYGKERGKTS